MIKLQFSAQADLASNAIRIFERGWCSHVDAVLATGQLLGARSDEVGGQPAGVQIRPPDYLPFAKTRVYGLQATGAQEDSWLHFLLAQVGKPYDKEAIAAFALGQSWTQKDSWICSALQPAALVFCQWFPHALSEDFNLLTPRDNELMIAPWAETLDSKGF